MENIKRIMMEYCTQNNKYENRFSSLLQDLAMSD